jgi:hypothetical protein
VGGASERNVPGVCGGGKRPRAVGCAHSPAASTCLAISPRSSSVSAAMLLFTVCALAASCACARANAPRISSACCV